MPERRVHGGSQMKMKRASAKPPDQHRRVQLVAASLAVCPACSSDPDLLTRGGPPLITAKVQRNFSTAGGTGGGCQRILKAASSKLQDHHGHVQLLAASLAVCPPCSPDSESVARAAPILLNFPRERPQRNFWPREGKKQPTPAILIWLLFFSRSLAVG